MRTPGRRVLWLGLLTGWIAAGPLPGATADETRPGEMTHVVQRGETLSSIAEVYLGNPHLWPALYRANRDQIRDPGHLYPGQTLSIPEVPTTAIPEGARHQEPAPRLERAAR